MKSELTQNLTVAHNARRIRARHWISASMHAPGLFRPSSVFAAIREANEADRRLFLVSR